MELRFDISKTYAIALEGGGAMGAYEVGVWKALEESGVKYTAVAGASVGALNGAMMTMRNLSGAIDAWSRVRLTDIVDVNEDSADNMLRLFEGKADINDVQELLPQILDIVKNRGLGVAPLRRWVTGLADTAAIKNSDVELFVTTIDLSDKKRLTVKVNDLPEDEICDMLLASAYHPSFRLEKLGGKYYTDGGLFDNLPIYPLVEQGYKDIIAVCLPSSGIRRLFIPPKDVRITYIDTDQDLGGVLSFDGGNARRNMDIGYYDAMRLLYGLSGRSYYIDPLMDEREAFNKLLDIFQSEEVTLRRLIEKQLPRLADKLELDDWTYHGLLMAHCEAKAWEMGLERMKIYSDREFVELTLG